LVPPAPTQRLEPGKPSKSDPNNFLKVLEQFVEKKALGKFLTDTEVEMLSSRSLELPSCCRTNWFARTQHTHTLLYWVFHTHNTHTHRSSDKFSYDFFFILGSSCRGLLANLSSLMWEIKYMINSNLPELIRPCVECAKENVVSSVLVVSSLGRQ
jgi:hypothetical protein